jgi:hypothetical protein
VLGDESRYFCLDAFVVIDRACGRQACQCCNQQGFAGNGLQLDLLERALSTPAATLAKAAARVTPVYCENHVLHRKDAKYAKEIDNGRDAQQIGFWLLSVSYEPTHACIFPH